MSVVRFAAVSPDRVGDSVMGYALLTDAERDRHDRLRFEADRAAYLAAHLLVRHAAAELLRTDPVELVLEQRCPDCHRTDHGVPTIAGADIHVSLSHTRGWVAAAAAGRPVGVDIERVRPVADGVLTRVLGERERRWVEAQADPAAAFTRLWVRKEALVKTGAGRLADAAALDVLGEDGPAAEVAGLLLVEWREADAVGVHAVAG